MSSAGPSKAASDDPDSFMSNIYEGKRRNVIQFFGIGPHKIPEVESALANLINQIVRSLENLLKDEPKNISSLRPEVLKYIAEIKTLIAPFDAAIAARDALTAVQMKEAIRGKRIMDFLNAIITQLNEPGDDKVRLRKLTTMFTEFTSATKSLEGVLTELKTVNKTVADQSVSIVQAGADTKQALDNVNTELTNTNTTVTGLRADTKEAFAQVTGGLTALNENVESLALETGSLSTLATGTMAGVTAEISALSQEVKGLSTNTNTYTTTMRGSLDTMQTTFDNGMKGQVNTIDTLGRTFRDNTESISQGFKDVNAELSEFNTSARNATNALAAAKTSLTDLSGKVTGVDNTLQSLNNSNGTVATSLGGVQQSLTDVQTNLTTGTIPTLLGNLQARITAMEALLPTFAVLERQRMGGEINTLRARLTQSDNSRAAMEASINSTASGVAELLDRTENFEAIVEEANLDRHRMVLTPSDALRRIYEHLANLTVPENVFEMVGGKIDNMLEAGTNNAKELTDRFSKETQDLLRQQARDAQQNMANTVGTQTTTMVSQAVEQLKGTVASQVKEELEALQIHNIIQTETFTKVQEAVQPLSEMLATQVKDALQGLQLQQVVQNAASTAATEAVQGLRATLATQIKDDLAPQLLQIKDDLGPQLLRGLTDHLVQNPIVPPGPSIAENALTDMTKARDDAQTESRILAEQLATKTQEYDDAQIESRILAEQLATKTKEYDDAFHELSRTKGTVAERNRDIENKDINIRSLISRLDASNKEKQDLTTRVKNAEDRAGSELYVPRTTLAERPSSSPQQPATAQTPIIRSIIQTTGPALQAHLQSRQASTGRKPSSHVTPKLGLDTQAASTFNKPSTDMPQDFDFNAHRRAERTETPTGTAGTEEGAAKDDGQVSNKRATTPAPRPRKTPRSGGDTTPGGDRSEEDHSPTRKRKSVSRTHEGGPPKTPTIIEDEPMSSPDEDEDEEEDVEGEIVSDQARALTTRNAEFQDAVALMARPANSLPDPQLPGSPDKWVTKIKRPSIDWRGSKPIILPIENEYWATKTYAMLAYGTSALSTHVLAYGKALEMDPGSLETDEETKKNVVVRHLKTGGVVSDARGLVCVNHVKAAASEQRVASWTLEEARNGLPCAQDREKGENATRWTPCVLTMGRYLLLWVNVRSEKRAAAEALWAEYYQSKMSQSG